MTASLGYGAILKSEKQSPMGDLRDTETPPTEARAVIEAACGPPTLVSS